jgi:YD repeat-containing protein
VAQTLRTKFDYDGMGQMLTATDRAGKVTTYEYDLAGNRTATTTPDGGRVTWGYDAQGKLIAEQTPNLRALGTSIAVASAVFGKSIHGGMSCIDCHADLAKAEFPHPEKLQKVSCATCHADSVKVVEQSIHCGRQERQGRALRELPRRTTSCRPRTWRRAIYAPPAGRPAQCHSQQHIPSAAVVADSHIDSAHGRGGRAPGWWCRPTARHVTARTIKAKTDPASR